MIPSEKGKPPNLLEKDLPGYRFDQVLGTGATSTVYRAVQTTLGRFVAIKRFDPATFLPASVTARFEREAAIWSHLSHENLIHLYDYRLTENGRYIILEYCHGIEMREAVERILNFPAVVVAAIATQILSALEYLHRYGIVHRDLKPANIFLTDRGVVKVMDFGISICPELEPITGPGQILGTPAYMSPEQAKGQEVTEASDYFAFGVLLYELLTGVKPYKPTSLEQLSKDPTYWKSIKLPYAYPSVFKKLVAHCLQINIRKRLLNIPEARNALDKYLRGENVANPREFLRAYLNRRGLVPETHSLFWIEAVKETATGPLGTTFAQLFKTQVDHRGRGFRWLWLTFGLIAAIAAAIRFGPEPIRVYWQLMIQVLTPWVTSLTDRLK